MFLKNLKDQELNNDEPCAILLCAIVVICIYYVL